MLYHKNLSSAPILLSLPHGRFVGILAFIYLFDWCFFRGPQEYNPYKPFAGWQSFPYVRPWEFKILEFLWNKSSVHCVIKRILNICVQASLLMQLSGKARIKISHLLTVVHAVRLLLISHYAAGRTNAFAWTVRIKPMEWGKLTRRWSPLVTSNHLSWSRLVL